MGVLIVFSERSVVQRSSWPIWILFSVTNIFLEMTVMTRMMFITVVLMSLPLLWVAVSSWQQSFTHR